jgi:putative flippase GtrA
MVESPQEKPPAAAGRVAAVVRAVQSPELGIVGQGLRYALSGGIVATVYVLTTLLLSQVVGMPFQLALVLGFALALATHFTLQRVFVWVHHGEFALPVRHQAGRYLAISLTQYVITAASVAALPGALGVPTEVVYLVVTAVVSVVNFVLFRTRVFHADDS